MKKLIPSMPVGMLRPTDLDEASICLIGHGCVAISGAPGMGKTTLARALEPDLWVDVEGARTVLEVQSRVAAAVGSVVENLAGLRSALENTRRAVLDGADALIPGDPAFCELVVSLSEVSEVVVTCRHPPDALPTVMLGPLGSDAGVALLSGTLRDRTLAESLDSAKLTTLVERLDGVPLAIELVAEQVRLHGLDAVLSRVPSALLSAGGLRQSIEENLAVLGPDVREVLEVAACLPGNVSADRLAVAAGRPVDVALSALLDAGLMLAVGGHPPHFRVLAPIKAALAVHPARMADVVQRLTEPVLAAAERAASKGDLASLMALGRARPLLELLVEQTEGVPAFRAALALAARELRTGPHSATLARAERLNAGNVPAALRIAWAVAVARAAAVIHEPERGEAMLAQVEGDLVTPSQRADWLSMRSLCALVAGDREAAERWALEACDLDGMAWRWFRLGTVWFYQGRYPEASTAAGRAMTHPDPFRRGQAAYLLGACNRQLGESAADILAVLDSVGIDEEAWPWLVPRFQFLRGILHADAGRLPEARRCFAAAHQAHSRLGEQPDAFKSWLNAQILCFIEGQVPEGLLHAPTADPGDGDEALLRAWQGIAHAANGHPAAAIALGLPALEHLRANGARQHSELAVTLATALAPHRPDLSQEILGTVDADLNLAQLASQVISGEPLASPTHMEERVLHGISSIIQARTQVATDGSWFVNHASARVDISRRRVLRRVLAALAGAPASLDVAEITAHAWPGETLVAGSGVRRVHVAISTLRSLGLRAALKTEENEGRTAWRLVAERRDPQTPT